MDKSKYERKEDRLCTAALDLTQTAEAGGEMTMADYFPEIRRVVSVSAEALPDSGYLSDGSFELGGTLAFNMLYIGDDGALSSASYVTEYVHTFPIDKDSRPFADDIRYLSSVESVSCRPLGPRTVSLRARLKSRIFAERTVGCSMELTLEDSSPVPSEVNRTVEKLEREVPTVTRHAFTATGSQTGEEKLSHSEKPVLCSGRVIIESAKAGDDFISVKGQLEVTCLLLTSEGSYRSLQKKLPLEERIAAEGCRPQCTCGAFGRAASVTVTAEDEGVLRFDTEYDLDAVFATVARAVMTEDVYSTEYAVDKKTADLSSRSLICLCNGSVFASGEGRRKSERREADRIIYSTATAKADHFDIKDSVAVVTGTCTVKALIASEGDVVTEEISFPIRYECPSAADIAKEDICWNVRLSCRDLECSLSEGTVSARCNIGVFAEAVKEERLTPVIAAAAGMKDRTPKDGAVIHLCYPEKGQRIWDIAKERRVSIGECERLNGVSRFDLSDGKPLIIK